MHTFSHKAEKSNTCTPQASKSKTNLSGTFDWRRLDLVCNLVVFEPILGVILPPKRVEKLRSRLHFFATAHFGIIVVARLLAQKVVHNLLDTALVRVRTQKLPIVKVFVVVDERYRLRKDLAHRFGVALQSQG